MTIVAAPGLKAKTQGETYLHGGESKKPRCMYNALLFLRQATCSPFPLTPTKPAEVRRNDTSSFLLTMKCASGNVQLEVLRGITKIL